MDGRVAEGWARQAGGGMEVNAEVEVESIERGRQQAT